MYYFIFGINNSGTTVVSQYLARQADAFLPPFGNNEGQDAPAVKSIFRTHPWKRDKAIDWAYVRSSWDELRAASGKSIFVEGSPPMMMWVDQIRAAFSDGFAAMFLTASPYMQIASCIRNYTETPLTEDSIDRFCKQWVFKARMQVRNIADHPDIPHLTYEDFCADPTRANAAFGLPVDKTAMQVAGKGWHRRGKPPDKRILDFTTRTMGFLTLPEIAALTDRLRPHENLLAALGHALLSDADAEARLAAHPGQRETALAMRAKWDAQT